MGELKIDDKVVSQYESSIRDDSSCFEPETLSPKDDLSTLTANAAGVVAFDFSQNTLSLYGTHLATDAENIHTLNVKFKEYDEMISTLLQSGN